MSHYNLPIQNRYPLIRSLVSCEDRQRVPVAFQLVRQPVGRLAGVAEYYGLADCDCAVNISDNIF